MPASGPIQTLLPWEAKFGLVGMAGPLLGGVSEIAAMGMAGRGGCSEPKRSFKAGE